MPTIKKTKHRPWKPQHKPFEGFAHHNTEFYQSREWRRLRSVKLQQDPVCELCLKEKNIITPAKVVDHIVPINKGGAPLDLNNLQSLCYPCHSRKSATDK